MRDAAPKKSILLVEDDVDIRELLCRLFEDENFSVLSAANGEAALEILRSAKQLPDLILLDLMMPVMDAIEFRHIQELDPKIASVPVLVMSAHPDIDVKRLKLGVNHYVRKPLDVEALLSAVETTLRQSRTVKL